MFLHQTVQTVLYLCRYKCAIKFSGENGNFLFAKFRDTVWTWSFDQQLSLTNEVDIWRNYQYFWHHLKLYFGLLNIHIPRNLSGSTFIFLNQSLHHLKILSSHHLGNSRLCIYVFMNFFIFQPRFSFHIETSNLFYEIRCNFEK